LLLFTTEWKWKERSLSNEGISKMHDVKDGMVHLIWYELQWNEGQYRICTYKGGRGEQ